MDATLTERWLEGFADIVPMLDEASLTLARDLVRRVAQGMPEAMVERLTLVVSELGRNQLRHARYGRIGVRPLLRENTLGIEVAAVDRGDGIADPATAFAGKPRSSGSLGVGLASVRGGVDELDVDVRIGVGTCLYARKFASPLARRREVGVIVRPAEHETVAGDDAMFLREGERLRLVVADGVGHGVHARAAAATAVDALRGVGATTDVALLEVDHRLHDSRGCAIAVVDVDEGARTARMSGVGNVEVHHVKADGTTRLAGRPGSLGQRGRKLRVHVEDLSLDPRDVVLVFTDGLLSRTTLTRRDPLVHEHPILVAQKLLQEFGRKNDDATVLVAR
ncbi:MAG: SpoIIE family protein phosphatase [Myxococcales bacterium]|nr:SpoIIE family protein phosphatase [Myxococcales bacterium]